MQVATAAGKDKQQLHWHAGRRQAQSQPLLDYENEHDKKIQKLIN